MNSTVTVITAADETKLATIERAKATLGIIGTDSDPLLNAALDDATSDIAIRCGPSLKRETITETFYPEFEDYPPREISLSNFPVASIASVTIDGDAVDASEYRFDRATGLLYRMTPDGFPQPWVFYKSLAVVYDAGYLLPGQQGRDLPASLEAACIELVTSYWASRGRDPAIMEREVSGVSRFRYWVGAVGEAGELPPGVEAKIAPFRAGGYL